MTKRTYGASTSVAGFVMTALLAAGCGGDSGESAQPKPPPPPTKAEYIATVDAACSSKQADRLVKRREANIAQINERIRAGGAYAPLVRKDVRIVRQWADVREANTERVRAVEQPADGGARRFFALRDRGVKVQRDYARALELAADKPAAELAEVYRKQSAKFNRAWVKATMAGRKYGLQACVGVPPKKEKKADSGSKGNAEK